MKYSYDLAFAVSSTSYHVSAESKRVEPSGFNATHAVAVWGCGDLVGWESGSGAGR